MTKIAGSIGKATTIISSDVEIIVFVNKVHLPHFENVLAEFEGLLRNWRRYVVKIMRRTQYSIQFTVNNYDFELLPAIDFVDETNIGADRQLVLQQQRTLNIMKEDLHRNVYRYSSSLTFSTDNFMKKQSPFAHDMARLAKFWYKSACVEEYVSGAEYVMELIAFKASGGINQIDLWRGLQCEKWHMLTFQKFLEDVQHFDSLDIIFKEEYRSLYGHKPCRNRAKPSVLDPANPYNNLAEAFMDKPKVIKALKMHAERTLHNIRGMQFDDDRLNMLNFNFWHIIDIFKPDIFVGKVNEFFGSCTEIASKQYKPIEVRVNVSDTVRKQIEFLQICLTAICKQTPGYDPRDRLELIYKKKYPDANFVAVPGPKHEDYDATICLKIENLGAAVYSFDLPIIILPNKKERNVWIEIFH